MDVRGKLIELLTNSQQLDVIDWATGWEEAANYLIAHGVTVQEWISVEDVEVVHGRWEEMHYEGGILDGTNFDRCSVCGYERVFDDPALKTVFKYCPNCGAIMDEEASE